MSVDLKFVCLLSKQTYNFVSTSNRAYNLSRFIDEIIIPNEMISLVYVRNVSKGKPI